MKIKILALMIFVFAFCSFSVNAQETRDSRKAVVVSVEKQAVIEKYDELSRFSTKADRQAFARKQTPETLVKLWNEHFDRKIVEMNLTKRQIKHLKKVRNVLTVEFFTLARTSNPYEKAEFIAFNQAVSEAFDLFTKEQITELFYELGSKARTVSKLEYEDLPPIDVGVTCNCNSESICSPSDCFKKQNPNACREVTGCGCFWAFTCNAFAGSNVPT